MPGKCNANVDRLRGYRIEIYPTDEQKEKINLVINSYRAIYNTALGIQEDNRAHGGEYIKYFKMCKIFSEMRNSNPEYEWFNLIQLSTIRQALTDLNDAFENFFSRRSRYPKYKTKKHSKKFFTTRSDRTHVNGNFIRIPEIGCVEAKNHNIPQNSILYSTGVHFDGYRYWFYCQVEKDFVEMNVEKSEPVGIDVGIRNMITTSDGHFYKYSDISKLKKRLSRQDRRLSKYYNKYLTIAMQTKTKYEDLPKSKNMHKRLESRYKTQEKIKNKLKNDIHCATKEIVSRNPSAIVIEDIRVRDQLKKSWAKKFATNILYYEIHRQLKYKAEDRHIPVFVADKSFPSSQLCSECGNTHKVYSNKIYKCPYCGLRMDRDLNAAINLRNLVIS